MRIVAALGGNALLERGEPPEAGIQEAHVVTAVRALAPLAAAHDLVITHGNGPQVGMLALESAHDPALARPYPFDVLGAQTQGMIGYWLVQALQNALPGRQVACLVSRTLVRRDDPAFAHPSKFVGPVYDEEQARALAASQHWEIRQDGARWRRVVPSPEPAGLLDLPAIRTLLGTGAIVVCAGGGGVPVVVRGRPGPRRGGRRGQGPDRRRCWPASWTRTRCCCSPTWPRSRTATAPRRPGRSAGPHPPSCGSAISRPGRWGPRSRPCAGSPRRPAGRPPSGGSPTRRPCSAGRPSSLAGPRAAAGQPSSRPRG